MNENIFSKICKKIIKYILLFFKNFIPELSLVRGHGLLRIDNKVSLAKDIYFTWLIPELSLIRGFAKLYKNLKLKIPTTWFFDLVKMYYKFRPTAFQHLLTQIDRTVDNN